MNPLNKIYRAGHVLAVLCVLALLTGIYSCGDDEEGGTFDYPLEGTVYSMDDLAGTWNAIAATFEDLDDETNTLDIVGDGGTATLTIQSNGRFTFEFTYPGEGSLQFSGQMGFDGNALVILVDGDQPGEDEGYFAVNLINEQLFITGPVEFDVDFDGTDEFAYMDLALE